MLSRPFASSVNVRQTLFAPLSSAGTVGGKPAVVASPIRRRSEAGRAPYPLRSMVLGYGVAGSERISSACTSVMSETPSASTTPHRAGAFDSPGMRRIWPMS